jgi:hypothetical protein
VHSRRQRLRGFVNKILVVDIYFQIKGGGADLTRFKIPQNIIKYPTTQIFSTSHMPTEKMIRAKELLADNQALHRPATDSSQNSFDKSNRRNSSRDNVVCGYSSPHKFNTHCQTGEDEIALPTLARCLVSSRSPHRIITVSPDFSKLVDFSEYELVGRTFAILRGPETNTPLISASIKAACIDLQSNVQITLYGRAGDILQRTATFAAALDRDGCAIGCEISIRHLENAHAAMPPAPPAVCADSSGKCTSGTSIRTRRRRNNLYVGLLLDSESEASKPTAAARLEEDALLCRLLAEACG